MAANDSRALTRPPRPHGVIDPVVIFGWTPRGENVPSKNFFFDNTPYITAQLKEFALPHCHPLFAIFIVFQKISANF